MAVEGASDGRPVTGGAFAALQGLGGAQGVSVAKVRPSSQHLLSGKTLAHLLMWQVLGPGQALLLAFQSLSSVDRALCCSSWQRGALPWERVAHAWCGRLSAWLCCLTLFRLEWCCGIHSGPPKTQCLFPNPMRISLFNCERRSQWTPQDAV